MSAPMMTTILGRANRRPVQPTTRAIDPGSRPPGGGARPDIGRPCACSSASAVLPLQQRVTSHAKDFSGCGLAARRDHRRPVAQPTIRRPTTGAAHGLEHFLIFLATGLAFGFGYSRRAGLLTIALPSFAAAIEVAQNWVPGRDAPDFVEVGEAGIAVDDAMRRQRRVQLVG